MTGKLHAVFEKIDLGGAHIDFAHLSRLCGSVAVVVSHTRYVTEPLGAEKKLRLFVKLRTQFFFSFVVVVGVFLKSRSHRDVPSAQG